MRNAIYRLVLRGELGARYQYLFNGMELTHSAGTTVLTGQVRDSAQLYGFIERIAELGLELLSLESVSNGNESTNRADQSQEG